MRILIIKTSSLGDVIHALPVLDYLHQVVPNATIDWVVEESFKSLVAHNSKISQVHIIRTKAWRKKPFSKQTRQEIDRLRQKLSSVQYDVVFDLQGNLKSGLVAWLSGTPERVGFAFNAVQEKLNLLFTIRRVPFRAQDKRAASRYLRIVSGYFGSDYNNDMEHFNGIVAAPEDTTIIESYLASLPQGSKILLQVGTTWSTKWWYKEGWIELARHIRNSFPAVTMLINWGSPAEKELGECIAAEVGEAVQLLPWFKISELIPLIQKVDLVIGGDTGPIYIAGAVGTPTVSLYRATRAELYAPIGTCHRSIQASMECAGCLKTSCDRDDACRRSIAVKNVFDAVCDIMKTERCVRHVE